MTRTKVLLKISLGIEVGTMNSFSGDLLQNLSLKDLWPRRQNCQLKHRGVKRELEMMERSDQNRGVAEDKPRKLKQEL